MVFRFFLTLNRFWGLIEAAREAKKLYGRKSLQTPAWDHDWPPLELEHPDPKVRAEAWSHLDWRHND